MLPSAASLPLNREQCHEVRAHRSARITEGDPPVRSGDERLNDAPLRLEGCIEAFDRELAYLYATLRRLGARPSEIDDLVHRVFLLLVDTWPLPALRRSLRLHLFSLAVRALAGHGHRRFPSEPLPLTQAALERVPLKRRAVLVLADMDQVPVPEIAASLSMTRFGVSIRVRKARKELETAIRQMAAEWRAGRFGHPDLLFAALGVRPQELSCLPRNQEGTDEDSAEIGGPIERDLDSSEASARLWQLEDDICLLEMVMDDLPEAIYFKDRESRFTHINRLAAAHYGIVDPALAIGRTDFDFFTDEHAVQALRDEQEIIRTGKPLVGVEERETLPDGKLRTVWTTKLPLHDRSGAVVGTFGLSRKIIERTLAGSSR